MSLRFLIPVLFLVLIGQSLSAQSQKGKHTLYFFPFHNINSLFSGGQKSLNYVLGLGYEYHHKEDVSVIAKAFLRQVGFRNGDSNFDMITEKTLKCGIQHLWVNKKLQVLINMVLFAETQTKENIFYLRSKKRNTRIFLRNHAGFEFGLGLGYRFNHQARLYLGLGFQVGYGKEREAYDGGLPNEKYNTTLVLNPLESFGFGYTF